MVRLLCLDDTDKDVLIILFPTGIAPATETPTHPTLPKTDDEEAIIASLVAKCHPENSLRAHGFKLQSTNWENNTTLKVRTSALREEFRMTPAWAEIRITTGAPQLRPRLAIVIDCEMVICGDHSEVAYLCALNLLTGDVLIDHHVQPNTKVTRWNTFVTGVTPLEIYGCGHRLVGHAIHNDVNALGMWHDLILDSAILTSEAVFVDCVSERTWSLKALTKEFMGYDIRGHSALEDARATRGVVLWCVQNPEKLETWASMTRGDHPSQIAQRNEENRLFEEWANEGAEQTEKECDDW
ncbi:hypothetical protein PoHVEF18_005515 [Penicillium ochrochloron]